MHYAPSCCTAVFAGWPICPAAAHSAQVACAHSHVSNRDPAIIDACDCHGGERVQAASILAAQKGRGIIQPAWSSCLMQSSQLWWTRILIWQTSESETCSRVSCAATLYAMQHGCKHGSCLELPCTHPSHAVLLRAACASAQSEMAFQGQLRRPLSRKENSQRRVQSIR